jgi:predicted nucleic acid-binding protein
MEAAPLVIDANVLVYMLLEGEKSSAARRLHESHPDWVCPTMLRHEFMNVCATYRRAGGFSREECLALVTTGVSLLQGREVDVDPEAAVGAAMDLELSANDAQYVALALALRSVLVPEDRTVLARAPGVARSVDGYA